MAIEKLVSPSEWLKLVKKRDEKADKKVYSFLKAIADLNAKYVKSFDPAYKKLLVNNLKGLTKELDNLQKATAKDNKTVLSAISQMQKNVKSAQKILESVEANTDAACKAHVGLREELAAKYKTVFVPTVQSRRKDADAAIKLMKDMLKAKKPDEARKCKAALARLEADLNKVEGYMKAELAKVRNPTGKIAETADYIPMDFKAKTLIPMTNKIFEVNKAMLKMIRDTRDNIRHWNKMSDEILAKMA